MKKILNIIWVLLLLVFISQLVNYRSNEQMIQNYEKEKYEVSKYASLGFFEPYIAHYNAGDVYFQKKEYKLAESQYRKALKSYSPSGRNVKIRINLALSIATPVNPDYISASEVDETVDSLREAQDFLTYRNYANADGSSGTHRKAQLLYNDIEALIQQLLQKKEDAGNQENSGDADDSGQNRQNRDNPDGNDQNQQSNGNPDDSGQNQQNRDNPDGNDQNQQGNGNPDDSSRPHDPIRDEIGDIMGQGNQQRSDELNRDQTMFDYNYNGGKNW